ncbi:uncharacterized protein [Euwallacea fornicatus]
MENSPCGTVESKLDLKNPTAISGIFDGITNSYGDSQNVGTKKRTRSKIPISLRLGANGLRRQKTCGQSIKQSSGNVSDNSATSPTCTENASAKTGRDQNTRKNSFEEESQCHLDKVNEISTVIGGDKSTVKVAYSEITRYDRSDVVSAELGEMDAETFPSNQPNDCTSHFKDNLNNNSVDFIEMLTLDAKEFLNVKCVCDIEATKQEHFCKDCFDNFKAPLGNPGITSPEHNNNSGNNDEVNELNLQRSDDSPKTNFEANKSCEPEFLDNGLLSAGEIDENNDEKSEINCPTDEVCHARFCDDLIDLSDEVCEKRLQDEWKCPEDESKEERTDEKSVFESDGDESTKPKDIENEHDIFRNILKAIQKSCEKISSGIPPDLANDIVKYLTSEKTNNEISKEQIEQSFFGLDPKNVLQHLVNLAGHLPDSSETFPSSSSSSSSRSHRRQSSYGESCASHESIGPDGRPQEQAPICSRESDVDVVVSDAAGHRVSQHPHPGAANVLLTEDKFVESDSILVPHSGDHKSVIDHNQLTWGFKNGRLVFEESTGNLEASDKSAALQLSSVANFVEPPVSRTSTDGTAITEILSSKSVNRRIGDSSNSRLKRLEHKLKEAGIVDSGDGEDNLKDSNNFSKTHQYKPTESPPEKSTAKVIQYTEFRRDINGNENANTTSSIDKENNIEGEDLIPDGSHDFCQFDVSDFKGFSSFSANQLGIYDEFIQESSSDESCECDEDHFIVIRRIRGDGTAMVNDATERSKHNPDRDNLKSLLKKPGRGRNKKSNRVVFNETKNEFFDADYIILIREDCELDDDEDDGICTCQQHEMVRLTCCEPNCSCQYDSGIEQTPQSPKFAPPMEFVDAVTLSPPEGYKDMELMAAARGQQKGPMCRECSAAHEEEIEEEGEVSQSDSEMDGQLREKEEKEKTDQSQQTTPTTPPSSDGPHSQSYILDTLRLTKSHQQAQRESEQNDRLFASSQGSPISGILKGGRLWKQQSQQSVDVSNLKTVDASLLSSDSMTSDEEGINRRSVRFIESGENGKRDICDGAPESSPEEEIHGRNVQKEVSNEVQLLSNKQEVFSGNSPEAPEMTLTFKLGNHVLISNNSLKPNSAVRQLFPCTKSLAAAQGVQEEENNSQQYLVTAESLRAFEEAKRSKLPQIIQSGETDETIKRAIERNTLRRSLIRYEPKSKKQPYRSDNSLVERIKQLTCDVDNSSNTEKAHPQSSIETNDSSEDVPDNRSSPPGEESRNSPDVNTLNANKAADKSFSPSSSSTASSNSSVSINQNYQQPRKLSATGEQLLLQMDTRRLENIPDIQNNFRRDVKPLPDIGGPHNHDPMEPTRASNLPPDLSHCIVSNKMSSSSNTSESRRQFLSSTLAPLTACVTMGMAHNDDYYYHLTTNGHPGDRISVASSGTEYSLEDIDEGLKTEDDEQKRIAPDVLAGTPSASESGDELAMFVQQDAGRIERIKKKYQPAEQQQQVKDSKTNDEDDENDDYGFNRRPSVRGIKPRFSTTTEILQQIQNQLQPPPPLSAKVAWPYYSESGLTDNKQQQKNVNNPSSNYHYITVGGEEIKTRGYPPQYRPTSLQEESVYQNCANQRCVSRDVYHRVGNSNVYSSVIRMGNDYYQSLPLNRQRNGRPQSPPPTDMSKQYHQTMVYIPYNHIEGYQPVQYYHHAGASDYATRVSSHNQINKRYAEPIYQSRVHHHAEDHHYNPNAVPPVPPKAMNRVSYPNGQPPPPPHVMGGSRSESPLPGQFSTARSTQTPGHTMSTCGYYPPSTRYRPVVGPVWQGEGNYATKMNRHSFPSAVPR